MRVAIVLHLYRGALPLKTLLELYAVCNGTLMPLTPLMDIIVAEFHPMYLCIAA